MQLHAAPTIVILEAPLRAQFRQRSACVDLVKLLARAAQVRAQARDRLRVPPVEAAMLLAHHSARIRTAIHPDWAVAARSRTAARPRPTTSTSARAQPLPAPAALQRTSLRLNHSQYHTMGPRSTVNTTLPGTMLATGGDHLVSPSWASEDRGPSPLRPVLQFASAEVY